MMLTGLQNPSKTLPLDGTLGKSQHVDSETVQPVSFGEILKRKEKQLQLEQEVSASSIAAALAALQTMSVTSPLPTPAMETVEPNESTAQAAPINSSLDGRQASTLNSIGTPESWIASPQVTAQLKTSLLTEPVPGMFSSLPDPVGQTASPQTQSVPAAGDKTEKLGALATSTTLANEDPFTNAVPTSYASVPPDTVAVGVDLTGNKPVSQNSGGQAFARISETQASATSSFGQTTKANDIAPQGATPTAAKPTTEQPGTVPTLKTAEAELAPANSTGEARGSAAEFSSQVQEEIQLPGDSARTTTNTPEPEQSVFATARTADEEFPAETNGTVKQPSLVQTEPAVADGKMMDDPRVLQTVDAKLSETVEQTPATVASTMAFKLEDANATPVFHSDASVSNVEAAYEEPRTISQPYISNPSSGVEQPSLGFVTSEKTDVQSIAGFKPAVINVEMAVAGDEPEPVRSEVPVSIRQQDLAMPPINASTGKTRESGPTQVSSPTSELPQTETAISEKGTASPSGQLKTETTAASDGDRAAGPATVPTVEMELPLVESDSHKQRVQSDGLVAPSAPTESLETEKIAMETSEREVLPQDSKAAATNGADVPAAENSLSQAGNADASTVEQVSQTVIDSGTIETQFTQQTTDSIELKDKPDIGHESLTNKSEPAAAEASAQAAPTSDQVVFATSRPTSVEEPKESVKTGRSSNEETVEPAEKQSQPSRMPEVVAPANVAAKESVAAEPSRNIPVGQINAQAAEVAQQVIRHLRTNIKSGPTSMHLQLNPKDLGAIDVQMVSSSEGLQVTFFAEQLNTGKLLESQFPQLRASLADSGVQLTGLNISQHNQSGQKGETFGQNTNFAQTSQRDLPQGKPGKQEASPAERKIGQLSEVDYLI